VLRDDPALYDLLAQAYAATGQTADSVRALVQSAEHFLSAGDAANARLRLTPVAFAAVPDDYVVRYASVIGTGVTVSNIDELPPLQNRSSLLGMLAIAARPKTSEEKERATRLLRERYGVTDLTLDASSTRGEASMPGGERFSFQLDNAQRTPATTT
jgi:hypothetical protein